MRQKVLKTLFLRHIDPAFVDFHACFRLTHTQLVNAVLCSCHFNYCGTKLMPQKPQNIAFLSIRDKK